MGANVRTMALLAVAVSVALSSPEKWYDRNNRSRARRDLHKKAESPRHHEKHASVACQHPGGCPRAKATFFDPTKQKGRCGFQNRLDSKIVSVPSQHFHGADGKTVCGKMMAIFYEDKSILVSVSDECIGCEQDLLDLPQKTFSMLADVGLGEIEVFWKWV
ncbi:hypothetical protein IE53DRAFT_382883 [Violaceomyces palustris]|uniref:Uncharacterized protein n=1 Tax=Violaceomyces palustris TaxID=1673888 RepID=A0ACD0P8Y8_9BASI|nr:hypothetical protein IE53DRAFT_382883 [Violaceomyces palustris]